MGLTHGKREASKGGYSVGDSCRVASCDEFVGSSFDDGITIVSAVIRCVAGIHGDGCQMAAVYESVTMNACHRGGDDNGF